MAAVPLERHTVSCATAARHRTVEVSAGTVDSGLRRRCQDLVAAFAFPAGNLMSN
jgi:hypothetical protein